MGSTWATWAAWVGVCGCAVAEEEPVPPDPIASSTFLDAPTEPATWTYPSATVAAPVEPDDLSAALDAAVALALTYPAQPLVDAYFDRYATSATATCPDATTDTYGNTYWSGACNADDGTYFGGYLTQTTFEDLDSDGYLLTGASLSGNMTVVEPSGARIDLEGDAIALTGVSVDGTARVEQWALVGGFGYDGDPLTPWLADGFASLELSVTGLEVPSNGGRLTVVDGAVNPVVGGAVYSVRFAEATVGNAAVGSLCDEEPGGTATIRDPAGRWIEVTFSGPVLDVSGGDPAACDGCGEAVDAATGEALGLVCADFGPWFDWTLEVTP